MKVVWRKSLMRTRADFEKMADANRDVRLRVYRSESVDGEKCPLCHHNGPLLEFIQPCEPTQTGFAPTRDPMPVPSDLHTEGRCVVCGCPTPMPAVLQMGHPVAIQLECLGEPCGGFHSSQFDLGCGVDKRQTPPIFWRFKFSEQLQTFPLPQREWKLLFKQAGEICRAIPGNPFRVAANSVVGDIADDVLWITILSQLAWEETPGSLLRAQFGEAFTAHEIRDRIGASDAVPANMCVAFTSDPFTASVHAIDILLAKFGDTTAPIAPTSGRPDDKRGKSAVETRSKEANTLFSLMGGRKIQRGENEPVKVTSNEFKLLKLLHDKNPLNAKLTYSKNGSTPWHGTYTRAKYSTVQRAVSRLNQKLLGVGLELSFPKGHTPDDDAIEVRPT